jgi:hypothetical protein
MALQDGLNCARTSAADDAKWGGDMVDFIVVVRDSVMTALLAWGGVSAEVGPEPGLHQQPAGVHETAPVAPGPRSPIGPSKSS